MRRHEVAVLFQERLLINKKQIIKYFFLLFLLSAIFLVIIEILHLNNFHFHSIYIFTLSLLVLILSFTGSVIIVNFKESVLFRNYDPTVKIIINRKKELVFINKATINLLKANRLRRKGLSNAVVQLIDRLFPNPFDSPYEKIEYKTGERTILFTKIMDSKSDRIMFFGTDITDQKTNEVKIQMLLAGMEQSANAVLITDLDGKVIYLNRAFTEMTGYRKNEVIGKTPAFMQSGHHNEDFYDELWDTITKGEVWHGTFLNKRKDGELYWEESTITPVQDNRAGVYAFIALKEDITSRINMEKDLRLAKAEAEKANNLKSDFLANMSHEIRTPLNGLLGLTEILLTEEENPGRIDMLKLIKKSGEDLLYLVNDILELSRLEADKITIDSTSFSFTSMLEELEVLFSVPAAENGLKLEFDTAPEIPRLFKGGETQIRHILQNLIGNAIKFTKKGFVRINSSYKNGILRVEVEDSGIGIPEELQKKIFDTFQQGDSAKNKKFGGTGLGLSIANRLAELIGGNITVRSNPGEGTTFIFSVPIIPASSETDEEPALVLSVDDPQVPMKPDSDQTRGKIDFGYDADGLDKQMLEKLSEELTVLRDLANDESFDGILTIAENISGIAEVDVLKRMAEDLRKIWEHIDISALSAFILALEVICKQNQRFQQNQTEVI